MKLFKKKLKNTSIIIYQKLIFCFMKTKKSIQFYNAVKSLNCLYETELTKIIIQ